MIRCLAKAPPELAQDFLVRGMYLVGGGGLLRGLAQRIERETQVPVKMSTDAARGRRARRRPLHRALRRAQGHVHGCSPLTDAVGLLYEESDDIGVITLNRPEARNALTFAMYAALERAVRESTARCLVVTGADPAFCSGDDVRQVMGGGEQGAGAAMSSGPPAAADAGRRRAAAHRHPGHRRRQRRGGRLGDGAGDDGRHPRRQRAGQVR